MLKIFSWLALFVVYIAVFWLFIPYFSNGEYLHVAVRLHGWFLAAFLIYLLIEPAKGVYKHWNGKL